MTEQESLESQVDRLAKFILKSVPGEPSRSEGAIDTAIRLLAEHYPGGASGAIAEAVAEATANPGRTVEVREGGQA